jgi:phosphomannomutase
MLREGAVIGGEGNGGVIYPPVHLCRDSMAGMALILEGVAAHGNLARWLRCFRPSGIHKTKVECPSARTQHVLAAARRLYADQQLDLLEGVKVVWPETGSWLHIRPSNTEPVIRVIAECDTLKAARALCDDCLAALAPVLRA